MTQVFVVFAEKTAFNKDLVIELEHWIDEYQGQLPPLKNFILAVNVFQLDFLLFNVQKQWK